MEDNNKNNGSEDNEATKTSNSMTDSSDSGSSLLSTKSSSSKEEDPLREPQRQLISHLLSKYIMGTDTEKSIYLQLKEAALKKNRSINKTIQTWNHGKLIL